MKRDIRIIVTCIMVLCTGVIFVTLLTDLDALDALMETTRPDLLAREKLLLARAGLALASLWWVLGLAWTLDRIWKR